MMTQSERVIYFVAAAAVLVLVGTIGAFWWAGTVPSRPKGVAADAEFLWAPHVGLFGPRRGWWLSCWEDAAHIVASSAMWMATPSTKASSFLTATRVLLMPMS